MWFIMTSYSNKFAAAPLIRHPKPVDHETMRRLCGIAPWRIFKPDTCRILRSKPVSQTQRDRLISCSRTLTLQQFCSHTRTAQPVRTVPCGYLPPTKG